MMMMMMILPLDNNKAGLTFLQIYLGYCLKVSGVGQFTFWL